MVVKSAAESVHSGLGEGAVLQRWRNVGPFSAVRVRIACRFVALQMKISLQSVSYTHLRGTAGVRSCSKGTNEIPPWPMTYSRVSKECLLARALTTEIQR